MIRQIGSMNVLAISGGRIRRSTDGLTIRLPVGYGYTVVVTYDEGSDTYTVTREYKRGSKVWDKGTRENVYCDEIGEIAYRASCFRNIDTF